MHEGVNVELTALAASACSAVQSAGIQLKNHYTFECRDAEGNLKWTEEFTNIVPDAGVNDVLDKYLKGSAYTAAWYVGLCAASPTTAASDTMASHAGWTEVTGYTGARPALVLGSVSAKSVNNSASKAVFNCTANGTQVGGAFITSDSTKGGTTGVLFSEAAFTGGLTKSLDSGDTLSVTVTLTGASG